MKKEVFHISTILHELPMAPLNPTRRSWSPPHKTEFKERPSPAFSFSKSLESSPRNCSEMGSTPWCLSSHTSPDNQIFQIHETVIKNLLTQGGIYCVSPTHTNFNVISTMYFENNNRFHLF